jgi:hypothetical protein
MFPFPPKRSYHEKRRGFKPGYPSRDAIQKCEDEVKDRLNAGQDGQREMKSV